MGNASLALVNPAKGLGAHHSVPSTHTRWQLPEKGCEEQNTRLPATDSPGGFLELETAAVVLLNRC